MTPEAVRVVADAVQWVNLAVSVAMLVLLLAALRRWPGAWRLMVLPLGYAVMSVAFYVAALANAIPSPWTSLLSAALRLYSYTMALAIAAVVVHDARRFESGKGGADDD